MIMRSIAQKLLDGFSKRYNYDVEYMQNILTHSPKAFFRFTKITDISKHHEATSREAHYAAKLVGAVAVQIMDNRRSEPACLAGEVGDEDRRLDRARWGAGRTDLLGAGPMR